MAEIQVEPALKEWWIKNNWGAQVPWDIFSVKFYQLIGQPTPTPESPEIVKREYRVFEALMTHNTPNAVSAKRLNDMSGWFGPVLPYDSERGFIKQIYEIASDRFGLYNACWFHGDVDTVTAVKLLTPASEKPVVGTFLVRFSTQQPGTFTVSRLMKRKGGDQVEPGHARVERTPQGYNILGRSYKSLQDLVRGEASAQHLGLTHPVKHNAFQALNIDPTISPSYPVRESVNAGEYGFCDTGADSGDDEEN